MSRRVNFISMQEEGGGGVKLPSIFSGYNWVNDRQGGNQRFHSKPRHRNDGLQSLAPAGAKGGGAAVFSEDGRSILYNSRHRDAFRQQSEKVAPRQKSLPARKPCVSDRSVNMRKSNSASDKENLQNYRNAKQTVTIYLASPGAKDYELGPETKQVIHGIRTRSHEENYIRSNKFASSWAKVRAENLALRDGSPSEMSPTRLSCDGSHESPQRDGSPSKYTDVSGGSSGNQGHHRFILTKPRGRPPKRMQVKSTGKKGPSSSYFDEANKSEIPRRGSWEGSRETLGSKKDPGYQNTHTLGPGREEANDHNEEEKSTKRRPAWDSCVNVIGPLQPKINLRKYENELTFKPSITTKEEVYIAYTGHDRLYDSEDAAEPGDERYSSLSSDEDASDRSRSNSRSPGRNKERILSKREARAYLKMTAVYGSDAFKNQRKQWFLDKLALAQDQKAKLEEEMRKAEEKKRAEDRKKQQRQLNYVRDKFRKEQVHRFRTQYVTSRVLEHEQANRHEYGLPEDFDGGTYLNNDNSKSARSKAQATPSATNDEGKPLTPHTHLNGHSSEHKGNKPEISHNLNGSQHRKEEQSRHGLKDVTSNDEAFNANNRKQQTQKNIEEERQRQRQEKQKSWYAAYERAPRAEETRPTYETSNSLKKPLRKTLPLKTSNTAAHIKGKGTNSSEVKGAINGTNYKEENELKSSFEAENGSKAPNKLKDNSNSIEKTKNGSGKDGYIKGNNSNDINDRITNGKHGDSSNAKQALADKGDKNIHKNKKDIGPSLPHTKSHADTDNSKEKKENAPYIFTGHFRQEADGTYHKLDTIKQDKNNLDHKNSEENLPISTNEKPDNIKSSQPIPTEIVLQTDKLGDTNAKKHDMVEKNTSVSSSAQRQMVQNLVNKAKVNSQTGITTKIMSPQINSNQLNQNNHLNGRNKRKTSPTGHSDSKKSSNHLPARPSAIALLHVLEEAKPAETKQNSQPIPNDKTTDSNHEREELSRDRRSSKDVASKAVKKQLNHPKSLDTVQEVNSRRAMASSRRSTAAAGTKKKPQGKSTLAHLMFDVNRGPSWDPHQKIPKMEGIDTVVIETKDGKGHVVKQKKHVKSVVKDAEKQLNVPLEDTAQKRPTSKRSFKMASPDVTLGSDFDVDDDEEEAVGDIFERLRKKYNIQIDSDEED